MNIRLNELLGYVPEHLQSILGRVFEASGDGIQEIRVRTMQPLIIGTVCGSFAVLPDGTLSPAVGGTYIVTENDIKRIFQAVCENSVYAYLDDIRQGFVTIKGGHRVGIVGRAVTKCGRIENFREISSLNIRVAREVIGAANGIIDDILGPGGVINSLIVSPPMGGKTTVLRDAARKISDSGIKTAIADDRGELAAMYRGIPQNDIGIQSDVIENAPKSEAIVMLLRSMSPGVVITDEIASAEDSRAIRQCFGTGVSVVATAHGESMEDIEARPYLRELIGGSGFKKIIFLQKDGLGVNTRIFGRTVEVEA